MTIKELRRHLLQVVIVVKASGDAVNERYSGVHNHEHSTVIFLLLLGFLSGTVTIIDALNTAIANGKSRRC